MWNSYDLLCSGTSKQANQSANIRQCSAVEDPWGGEGRVPPPGGIPYERDKDACGKLRVKPPNETYQGVAPALFLY